MLLAVPLTSLSAKRKTCLLLFCPLLFCLVRSAENRALMLSISLSDFHPPWIGRQFSYLGQFNKDLGCGLQKALLPNRPNVIDCQRRSMGWHSTYLP